MGWLELIAPPSTSRQRKRDSLAVAVAAVRPPRQVGQSVDVVLFVVLFVCLACLFVSFVVVRSLVRSFARSLARSAGKQQRIHTNQATTHTQRCFFGFLFCLGKELSSSFARGCLVLIVHNLKPMSGRRVVASSLSLVRPCDVCDTDGTCMWTDVKKHAYTIAVTMTG